MICKFCEIVDKKTEDYVIWEDENFLLLLDINPAKQGHCMLIPKEHIDNIFDMQRDLYDKLFRTAKKLEKPLREATNAKRIGMIIVGFNVPHAHLHLVPLHKPNELFDPRLFSKGKHEELVDIQNKIKTEIRKFNL